MTVKIADYAVTRVRYEYYGPQRQWKRIAEVEVRPLSGNELGNPVYWKRLEVVRRIKTPLRESFITVPSPNGQWAWGDMIGVVTINGEDYLRTDGNDKIGDNLGSLPEY